MTMKCRTLYGFLALLAATAVCHSATAPGTAITYQGQLQQSGQPAAGVFDFRFSLYAVQNGGSPLGSALSKPGLALSNGLFTTTLDFGPGVFNGDPRWLEIAVRTGSDAFLVLTPRQAVLPAPYALYTAGAALAGTASNLLGTLPAAQLPSNVALLDSSPVFAGTVTAGSFLGNGAGLTEVDANRLGGLEAGGFWKVDGNSGTSAGAQFVGTVDVQPLELKVNGARALRLEPNAVSPSLVGGAGVNLVGGGAMGATIAGGGSLDFEGIPYPNEVSADYGAVGGGYGNTVLSLSATIAGGFQNFIGPDGTDNAIGGGWDNYIGSATHSATISGGSTNTIEPEADDSTVGGGHGNWISQGSYSAVIAGGQDHYISTNSDQSCISGGGFNTIGGSSYYAAIGGGYGNWVNDSSFSSVIAGGENNAVDPYAEQSVIAGGALNLVTTDGYLSVIGGGFSNTATTVAATVAGGYGNTAEGASATIPGGFGNGARGDYSFAAGRGAQANHDGSFVWADSTGDEIASAAANQFVARVSGGAVFYSNARASSGVRLSAGGGSWTSVSDRAAKENIDPVDPRAVLDLVAGLPMQTWNYKTQPPSVRHMGPMAQDFAAAFHLGEDDKGINTVDADGVALAAIQGLNQKVEAKTQGLEAENASLKQQVAELKRLVKSLAEKVNGGAQ
jgi:trimeric autotransporter adhesin